MKKILLMSVIAMMATMSVNAQSDEPKHEETVTVKDYQYCSICGERK